MNRDHNTPQEPNPRVVLVFNPLNGKYVSDCTGVRELTRRSPSFVLQRDQERVKLSPITGCQSWNRRIL